MWDGNNSSMWLLSQFHIACHLWNWWINSRERRRNSFIKWRRKIKFIFNSLFFFTSILISRCTPFFSISSWRRACSFLLIWSWLIKAVFTIIMISIVDLVLIISYMIVFLMMMFGNVLSIKKNMSNWFLYFKMII